MSRIEKLVEENEQLRAQVRKLTLYLDSLRKNAENAGCGCWNELEDKFDGLPGFGEVEE